MAKRNHFWKKTDTSPTPHFLKCFTYNFIEGSPDIALNNPNSMVISENMARKIFGNQRAVNKILHVNSNTMENMSTQ